MDNRSNEEKKESILWKVFVEFLKTLFPIFKILSINSKLKLAEETLGESTTKEKIKVNGREVKIYKTPYDFLNRQRKRNIASAVLASFPMIFGIVFSYMILSSNLYFMKGFGAFKRDMGKFKVIEAVKKFDIANQIDSSVFKDMKLSVYMFLGGIGTSALLGFIVVWQNPIVQDTKKFKEGLIKSGFIKETDNPELLATPIGFLMDISGHVPREIADSDRIWIPLNIRINKDWSENPKKRSLVFFKKAYELKGGNDYGFDKIPVEANSSKKDS